MDGNGFGVKIGILIITSSLYLQKDGCKYSYAQRKMQKYPCDFQLKHQLQTGKKIKYKNLKNSNC